MTSAVEALNKQLGRLQDPSLTNNLLDIDIDNFMLDVIKSQNLDIDIANSIVDGNINRTMDAASSLTVTVNDHNRAILRSGILGDSVHTHLPVIDVNFDANQDGSGGLWVRLVSVSKSDDNIDLVFEDRIVAYLREHKKPLKVSRRTMTRAQFIHSMVNEVKEVRIEFYSPVENLRPQIEKIHTTTSERRAAKNPGFHHPSKLKIKHTKPNKRQIEVGGKILAIAVDMGASDKVQAAAITVATTESTLNPNVGVDYKHSGHIGAFQQDSTPGSYWVKLGGATGNLESDTKAFVTAAMGVDKKFPKISVAMLADFTQYPGHQNQSFPAPMTPYAAAASEFVGEAKVWVKEFNGGDGGVDVQRREQYYFRRGRPDGPKGENTWDASDRLAQEVNWHRFVVGNTFFYVRDADLMKQIPADTLSEDDDRVDYIDFDVDEGKTVQEATIKCQAVRWAAHPGEVIVIEGSGPANGRWLVQEIDKPLFDPSATITVRQPHGSKKEPAPSTQSKTKNQSKKGDIGDVEILPGADGNAAGYVTKTHVLRFLELMAGVLGKKIIVTTGTHHNQYVEGTHTQSGHWTGDAVDLAMGPNHFSYGGKGGDAIAAAAATVLGIHLKDVTANWTWYPWTYKGVNYRVQVGWKTMVGGNHFNHVHVGVEKVDNKPTRQGPYLDNTPH